ncbi:hypothetical protein [Rhizorhabdus sp.]|uniref:hypothetical protein n=1 Tax=Rhizorhabdus sp. TaxID=1968843 RepID=UPI0035B443B3
MIGAGGIALGGLMLAMGWLGFRAVIHLGNSLAEEIGAFLGIAPGNAPGGIFDIRGERAGEGSADDHATDDDAQGSVHAAGVDAKPVASATGKILALTGEAVAASIPPNSTPEAA